MRTLMLVILVIGGCTPGSSVSPPAPDMAVFMFPTGCTSSSKDGDETDVDCGGSCQGCEAGLACLVARDCKSGVCINKTCSAASCTDGVRNGNESDIDCGGSCPNKCSEGQHCVDGPDCQSGTCANNICTPSLCSNKMKDGQETDVDCGGPMCEKCADGKACIDGTDCIGAMCVNNVCKGAGTCIDKIRNGLETDVDCGGPKCPACADGKACNASADCQNQNCSNKLCCAVGFGHCGGNACSTSLLTDANNCGSCGTACPMNTPTCLGGTCKPRPTLLLLHSTTAANAMDVQQKLNTTGAFSLIDLFDAFKTTPTLMQLQKYDVVLVVGDTLFKDGVATGNVLADYFDAGGQVVLTAGAIGIISGRFGDPANGYMLMSKGSPLSSADSLGAVNEPTSPLMKDVKMLAAQSAFRRNGMPLNGSVVVAEWGGKQLLIVRGVVKGRNRADVNLYPPSSDVDQSSWTGDGTAILRNALLYR